MKKLLLSDIIQPSVEGNSDFFARKAIAADFEGLMDPVAGINHFETSSNITGLHIGNNVSEILYIFEYSAPYQITGLNGSNTRVAPGSLLWLPGGRKSEHSESPVNTGNRVEGIQLFLSTHESNKKEKGIAINSSEIPVIEGDGFKVRVLSGSSRDTKVSGQIPQELTILYIDLESDKEFLHMLPANWSGSVFTLEGRFDIMTGEGTFELDEGMVMSMGFSEHNESIVFTGLTSAKLLFVSGQPLNQTKPSQELVGREPHLAVPGEHTNN